MTLFFVFLKVDGVPGGTVELMGQSEKNKQVPYLLWWKCFWEVTEPAAIALKASAPLR